MTNSKVKKILIYSTPSCMYCNMAKSFFKQNDISYENYDVAVDLDKRKEMVDKSGQMGVPVIDMDGEIMVGFDETAISIKLGL